MGKRIEVKPGDRYGFLVVIAEVDPVQCAGRRIRRFLCRCKCGKDSVAWLQSLRTGNTTSCGCALNNGVHHGHSKRRTRTYRAWESMKTRCLNQRQESYKNYGAKGIRICQRWIASFEAFLEDMGECPDGMTLDRFPNNNGNYEPGNCRWATRSQQQRNTSRNRIVEYGGAALCLAAWSERTGIPLKRISWRLRHGWTAKDALTIPLMGRRQ